MGMLIGGLVAIATGGESTSLPVYQSTSLNELRGKALERRRNASGVPQAALATLRLKTLV